MRGVRKKSGKDLFIDQWPFREFDERKRPASKTMLLSLDVT